MGDINEQRLIRIGKLLTDRQLRLDINTFTQVITVRQVIIGSSRNVITALLDAAITLEIEGCKAHDIIENKGL